MTPDIALLERRASRQGGALTRAQVLASGAGATWLAGRVRRRQWQRVHPGVYVTFTGPMPWLTRAWAASLYADPDAVLAFDAAAFEWGWTSKAASDHRHQRPS